MVLRAEEEDQRIPGRSCGAASSGFYRVEVRRIRRFLGEVAEQLPMAFAKRKTIPVPMRLWDTPVPIPNTKVKT